MTQKPPRVPPLPVARAINRVRAALQSLHRSSVPGNIALLELATGAWTTQVLYVGAKLGIPDQLADGPQHAKDLARRVGADADAMYRLMRAMASQGVLDHRRDDSFGLTKIGESLCSGTEGSLRDMVLFLGHPARWDDWGNLLHSVRTGEPSAEMLRGKPFFEYLESDPELAQVFNDAMTAGSELANDIALSRYDFTGFRRIVDVGGGHGALLATILRGAPAARGVLYDLPAVVRGAGPTLEAGGVADRCERAAGSFLQSVPEGGDAYVLKNIIHDWADDDALAILRNVRAAIAPGGKLLLLEMVLPERATSFIGLMLDLEMLVTVGGKERTRSEYANLFGRAGFRLTRVLDTVTPVSIIEATPA